MRVEQSPKFQEIKVILETSEDAMALWELVDEVYKIKGLTPEAVALAMEISTWFSMEGQLGGVPNGE